MPRAIDGVSTEGGDGPRKVTFFISSLRAGGAEGVCITLANKLVAREWHVSMVVLNLDGATLQTRLSDDIKLTVLGHRHARTAPLALWRYLRGAHPGTALVFNHQVAVLLVLVRLFTGLEFKIVARNISTLSEKRYRERSFWHREIVGRAVQRLYRKVDLAVAQSEGMRNDLLTEYGFDEKRVIVIHNPVSQFIEYRTDQPEEAARAKQSYFLCVGRLAPVKAFEYAIRAFGLIADDIPGFRLKFVGSGPEEKYLSMVASDAGVGDRVDMEGHKDDVATYYETAVATVLTSLYEGFPNVLVESIALGTPVIAFDCRNGPREIITHGLNGFLVPYQDIEALAAFMAAATGREWDRHKIRATASPYKGERIVAEYEAALTR